VVYKQGDDGESAKFKKNCNTVLLSKKFIDQWTTVDVHSAKGIFLSCLEVFIPTTPLPLSVPVQGQQLTPMQKHL
jgi:hypothetical protein